MLRVYYNFYIQGAKKLAKDLTKLSDRTKYAGLGLGAGFAGMIKSAQSYESAMAEASKTIDFSDGIKGQQKLKKQLMDMSTVIAKPFEDLAAIAASGGQLGIASKDIAAFTETVAKMSIAFDMTADEAGTSMAKIANILGLQISELGSLGDAINYVSNNSAAAASDIIAAMNIAAGSLQSFGMAKESVVAYTSALVALGQAPEKAGTALKSMVTTLQSTSSLSKDGKYAFKKLGINVKSFSKLVKNDGEKAMMQILEAINKLPKSERGELITDIFGKNFNGQVLAMANNIDMLKKHIGLVKKDANGKALFDDSMNEEFAVINATSANKTILFMNNIRNLSATIGDIFIPTLNDLMQKLVPVIKKMQEFAIANPDKIKELVVLTAKTVGFTMALGPAIKAMSAFGKVGMGFGSVIGGTAKILKKHGVLFKDADGKGGLFANLGAGAKGSVNLLKKALKGGGIAIKGFAKSIWWLATSPYRLAVGFINAGKALLSIRPKHVIAKLKLLKIAIQGLGSKAWASAVKGVKWFSSAVVSAFNKVKIAMMKNPVGLVLTGIAMLIAAGILLYKNWDKITAYWNSLCEVFKNSDGVFSGVWNVASKLFSDLGEWADELLTEYFPFWDVIKKGFSDVWNAVGGVVDTVWTGVINTARKGMNFIIKHINKIIKLYNSVARTLGLDEKKEFELYQMKAPKMSGVTKSAIDTAQKTAETKAQLLNVKNESKIDVNIKVPKGVEATANQTQSYKSTGGSNAPIFNASIFGGF